jgi:hypothetical protein
MNRIIVRSSSSASATVARDPGLLPSGSILIYCRASLILSLLVYGALLAKLYSDLYLHLIRQTARSLARPDVPPAAFFAALLTGAILLAIRAKSRLEKTVLLMVAANLGVFLLRRKASVHSDLYLALCAFSLMLDVGLLSAVIAFYRKYPNVLRALRSLDPLPGAHPRGRAERAP